MKPFERMKKAHIWLGSTKKNQNEFYKYFDQDRRDSQFGIDIGKGYYDEDFTGIMEVYEKNTSIVDILSVMAVDRDEYERIIEICSDKGITSANASFYYTDAQVEIQDTEKKYNDLSYIGVFDSGL